MSVGPHLFRSVALVVISLKQTVADFSLHTYIYMHTIRVPCICMICISAQIFLVCPRSYIYIFYLMLFASTLLLSFVSFVPAFPVTHALVPEFRQQSLQDWLLRNGRGRILLQGGEFYNQGIHSQKYPLS